jgi:PIN domain nuclease of toxin-antitoxin system
LRLLLDTHAALWWLSADERLGERAIAELEDDANEVLLSAAVVWEVALKRSLGKLDVPDDFAATFLRADVRALPVSVEHAAAVERLPWHHSDPFDRVLVAQATIEDAAVVSGDERLRVYGVPVVWTT